MQAQVSGQIISREFKDGADVKKGDLLFKIDSRAYEAVLAAAKADLVLAQANLKRNALLEAKDVMATQDLDTAKANAMRTEAAVAAAQVNVDYCSIRSPIDGRAGLRNVDVGNVVSPGAARRSSRSRAWTRSTPISPSPNPTFRWSAATWVDRT